MKKSLKLIIPVVIVIALVISTALAFTLTGGAAGEEATLATRTVTVQSAGYISAFGASSGESGDFATLAAKLATLAPTASTRYTLTLNTNVTLEAPITVATNENTEVIINLNGHTLTTLSDGDAITVTGGGTVRIFGDLNEKGENGRVIYSSDSGSFLTVAEGSCARVHLRHIDLDASALATGESAIKALGGTLTVQSSNIEYSPSALTDVSLILAKNSLVELKSSTVKALVGAEYAALAFDLDGADLYIENSNVTAKTAVSTTSLLSDILLVDNAISAEVPFNIENAASTLYILGGRTETVGAELVTGGIAADKVVFYYGTGNTSVVGASPLGFGIQDTCSFTEAADGWTMTAPESDTEAMQTAVTMGAAPTVSFSTYDKAWSATTKKGELPTVTRTKILTVLKDATSAAYKESNATAYNEWVNMIIDLNGHNVTINATGNFDTYGNPYMRYDGADADGKIGTMVIAGANPMYVRTRVKSSYSGANEETLYTFKNINVNFTKFDGDTPANPFICIQQGEGYIENVTFTYTGTASASTADRLVRILMVGSSSDPTKYTKLTVRNTTFRDVCENGFMLTYPIESKSGITAWLDNVTFDGTDYGVSVSESGIIRVFNSDISTNITPLNGAGTIYITDSTVTAAEDGAVATGSVVPVFLYGEGKNEILTGDTELSGSYTVEDGYALIFKGNGRYVLMDADNIINASVKMPAIFANGMVLQRNKPLNVYGYCDTEGATVEVTIGDKVATATVKDGRWDATFEPMDAAFGVTVEVRQTGDNVAYNLIRLTDVNIGEVWAISGQSNGDLVTLYMEDLNEFSHLADSLKNVRMYKSSIGYSVTEKTIGSGTWYEGTKANVLKGYVSAIGYVTAARLAAELGEDVPVAILHLARGSTKIKTWLDYETLKEISPSATKEYEFWLSQNTLPSNAHGGNAVGTIMYNNVIAPLEGYALAGVMWYQGEGDTGGGYYASTKTSGTLPDGTVVNFTVDENGNPYNESHTYTEYFYAVEKVFRRAFGNDDELPFYVMQISPFLSSSYTTANIIRFKLEQYAMCEGEANTHLVSLATDGTVIEDVFFGTLDPDIGNTDVTSQGFIHPLRKSTVGIRTADMILANEYGIQFADLYTYPKPTKVSAEGGVVTIEFDSELQIFYGDTVLGFELYDGTKWVKASGEIDGNKVILSADGVENPTEVRYGCGETLIELGDGTFIEITNSTYTVDKDAKTITVTYNGEQYVIRANTTDMIRTVDYGNITNASGVPMPIFGLVIED